MGGIYFQLSLSDMIRGLMNTYLHEPIKILQFLTRELKTVEYNFKIYNKPTAILVAHTAWDFHICYSYYYYSFMISSRRIYC